MNIEHSTSNAEPRSGREIARCASRLRVLLLSSSVWLVAVASSETFGGDRPTTVDSLKAQADDLFAHGKYKGAAEAYERLVKTPALDAHTAAYARFQQGLSRLKENQNPQAFAAWAELRRFYPKSEYAPRSLLLEANAPINSTRSEKLCEEILTKYPSSPEALVVCAAGLARGAPTREGQEALYRKGLALAALNKPADAVACWQPLLNQPGAGEWKDDALLETARTLAFTLKQPEAALPVYQRLLREYPRSDRLLEARYQMAGVYYLQHDHQQAQALFEKFVADYPDSPVAAAAKNYLAKCEAALPSAPQGVTSAASKPAETASAPDSPAARFLAEAEARWKKNDYKGAYSQYERLLIGYKTAPEYDLAALGAARCLVELEDVARAVRTLEGLVQWKPQSARAAEALLLAGDLCLEELDQPPQAQTRYEKLLTNYPQSAQAAPARYRLGLALVRQSQWDRARGIFEAERALRGGINTNAPPTELDRLIAACENKKPITPARPRSFDKVEGQIATADLLFTAKEYGKAARAYEKVVRAKPDSEEAAYSLMQAGRCYLQLFKPQQAIQCYRPFLKEYVNSQWADDALVRAAVIYIGQLRDKKTGTELLETVVARYATGDQADRALAHLATLARWDRNWNKAENLYAELLRRYPKSDYGPYVKTVALPELETLKRPTLPVAPANMK